MASSTSNYILETLQPGGGTVDILAGVTLAPSLSVTLQSRTFGINPPAQQRYEISNRGTVNWGAGNGAAAISLLDGGSVTNFGTIRGPNAGDSIMLDSDNTVENSGLIAGTVHFLGGTSLFQGGTSTFTNLAGGTVKSVTGFPDYFIQSDANTTVTVLNAGVMQTGNGINLHDGGTVVNTGTINTGSVLTTGINLQQYGSGDITNSGSITGSVVIQGDGSLVNSSTGTIQGATSVGKMVVVNNAAVLVGAGTLTNDGVITGAVNAGVITNTKSIVGDVRADEIISSGTITGRIFLGVTSIPSNANLIVGPDNSLTLRTGSVLTQAVDAGAGNDTLYLEGSGSESHVFQNFESLEVQASLPGWTLTGNSSFNTVNITSGALAINGIL